MYTIFKSLREDMNQGGVWLKLENIEQRCIVKIQNKEKGKMIYCEALQIDGDFRKTYKERTQRDFVEPECSIVMNAWYRKLLGSVEPQKEYPLQILSANCLWGKLKANQQHPQVVVRMSTMLGLVSVSLGLIGVGLGLLSLHLCIPALIGMGLGVLGIVLSVL